MSHIYKKLKKHVQNEKLTIQQLSDLTHPQYANILDTSIESFPIVRFQNAKTKLLREMKRKRCRNRMQNVIDAITGITLSIFPKADIELKVRRKKIIIYIDGKPKPAEDDL